MLVALFYLVLQFSTDLEALNIHCYNGDEYYDVQLKIMQRLLAACSIIIIVRIIGGEI